MDALISDEGIWVEDKDHLKNMSVNFYFKLFFTEAVVGADFITSHFPQINDELKDNLEKEVTMEETKRALMQMSSWKAPGPD